MPGPRTAGKHARATTKRFARRGLLLLAALMGGGVSAGVAWGFFTPRFVIVELVVLAGLLAIERRLVPAMDRWDRGATGEEHVGKILERLRDHDWHVVHDLDLGRGNVDHVIVGPPGVLTVETKSHGGRIDVTRLDAKMLKQAYAQAKAVSELTGQDASPLLVFSRAYLYPRPVSRQRGVVVLPARMLKGHLERRDAELSPEDARSLYERLLALQAS